MDNNTNNIINSGTNSDVNNNSYNVDTNNMNNYNNTNTNNFNEGNINEEVNNNNDNLGNKNRTFHDIYKSIYNNVKEFKKKYPITVAFRLKVHAKAAAKFIAPDEDIKYAFVAQKNYSSSEFVNTNIVVLTNKRILILTKRILFGYFYKSVTIDMFNDIGVKSGIIWGKVIIDTVKELIVLSNIDKRALPEIEQSVASIMLTPKKSVFSESRIN